MICSHRKSASNDLYKGRKTEDLSVKVCNIAEFYKIIYPFHVKAYN